MDISELKALGIAFQDSAMLEAAYSKHRLQPLLPLLGGTSLALDLDSLPLKPIPFKEIFLKWALYANQARLQKGLEPLFTIRLALACPLWKLIAPPIISLRLDKESLLKQVGRTQKIIGTATGGALKRSKG